MQMKYKGWLAAFASLLLWGLISLTTASADGPQILLAVTEEARVGERAELVARVSTETGEPVEGERVTFSAELEFLNNIGFVKIGEGTTDESGVARTFYVPRTAGDITIAAQIGDNEDEILAEIFGTLTTLDGEHVFHTEDLVHDLRGRWDWFVQWGWLVIVPASAFGIYLFIMGLLWAINRSATIGSQYGTEVSRRNLIVPVGGGLVILAMAVVLILGITLRPWSDADSGWRTELNFAHTVPDDYHRTIPTSVGDEPSQESWKPPENMEVNSSTLPLYVGYGCASCHGLDRKGGVVGDDLSEVSPSDVRKALKKGDGGMPEFASALSADEFDALVAYLVDAKPEAASIPAAVVAKPPPTFVPTPVVSPAAVPTHVPDVEPTVEPAPDIGSTPTPESIPVVEPTSTPEPAQPGREGPITLDAVTANITIDGDTSDWSEIPVTPVELVQIKRFPGNDMGQLEPIDASLRVAVDSERIYVLFEVVDDFDYVADDHGLSAAMAIMFRIDDPAAPHMGTTEEKQKRSLGKVDIWHWELDCGPGVLSGGVAGIRGGNDPSCNFDDEWAATPEDLEDDGSRQAENSLAGMWEHTARSEGAGANGTWVFEMSRKLQTGDPDDAQFESGTTANLALAYWDPDETPDGWTAEGHLQSSTGGWIEVTMP